MKKYHISLALLLPTNAFADIPPPNIADCQQKAVNDICLTDQGKNGTCQKDTCSKNDYSNGPPPSQVYYECLTCQESPKETTAKNPKAKSQPPTKSQESSGCSHTTLSQVAINLLFLFGFLAIVPRQPPWIAPNKG